MSERIIYIVTSGEYSDYKIEAVFDEKTLADEYVEKVGGEIEEFELNPQNVLNYARQGFSLFNVCFDKDFNTQWCEKKSPTDYSYYVESGLNEGKITATGGFMAAVWAKDDQGALKIASEKFASQKGELVTT